MQEQDSEEDRELKEELLLLVERAKDPDVKLVAGALDMLKHLIRTSTTSMTSVPKPLKYLSSSYLTFKDIYEKLKDVKVKKQCADIISILAMDPTTDGDSAKKNDCLRYCLLGTLGISDWGHEYIRQLEAEIVEQWMTCAQSSNNLLLLVKDIVEFDCKHNAEIQACDLLMEIGQLQLLPKHIDKAIYQRICLYLSSCVKYVEDIEAKKIFSLVTKQYLRFGEHVRALIVAMQWNNEELVERIFAECDNVMVVKQMAFIAARQLYPVKLDPGMAHYDDISSILSNSYLNNHFQVLARELDIMQPKTPEEVYKTWLEPVPLRLPVLGVEPLNSARQNLAASFVNGFVNAAFGCDNLLTTDESKWIYRNKDHGMMSTTATLGLIYLWDVDGGLTPLDKYFYSTNEHIHSGALLGVGIVNCRVRNECDPAIALLGDYITSPSSVLRTGAILGLGLSYAGTNHAEMLKMLLPAIACSSTAEDLAVASLACGLVAVGAGSCDASNAILIKLYSYRDSEQLKSPHMHLVVLGLALCYMGCRDEIETTNVILEVLPEPFRTLSVCFMQMCAYAGTGDVLLVQELLHIVNERSVVDTDKTKPNPGAGKDKKKAKREWNPGMGQAAAALAVAVVSLGEDIGTEMCQRIIGNMGRYGDIAVRRIMPVCVALTSVSRPNLSAISVLTKYAHDADEEVSCNAIFCLGIVGAGTNNARLATGLRQLAVYHMRNPDQLFMVRLSQGLTHMGKGTLTLSPLHTDRQLLDPTAMAGLLVPLVCLLDPNAFILGECHYFLFALAAAIQPRWLLTLDENLEPVSVPVCVGQAVDIVGKAGIPKTITGIHTHSTPVLLAAGERAELATDQYEQLCPTLDGVCVVQKKA